MLTHVLCVILFHQNYFTMLRLFIWCNQLVYKHAPTFEIHSFETFGLSRSVVESESSCFTILVQSFLCSHGVQKDAPMLNIHSIADSFLFGKVLSWIRLLFPTILAHRALILASVARALGQFLSWPPWENFGPKGWKCHSGVKNLHSPCQVIGW
jgi:hypothetical protein